MTPLVAGILTMGLHVSAYLAEIYRAGILSIADGQRHAGLSLGMTPVQVLRRIVLPQAVTRMLPPIGSQFISLFKDSALVSLISVPIVAGLVQFFGQKIHVRFKSVQDYFGDLSARVQENLAGVRVIRAFGQEDNVIRRFKGMNREYVSRNRTLIRLTATFYPMLHGIIGVMFGIVFFMGSRRMISGALSIGAFVAFQFYLGRMICPRT